MPTRIAARVAKYVKLLQFLQLQASLFLYLSMGCCFCTLIASVTKLMNIGYGTGTYLYTTCVMPMLLSCGSTAPVLSCIVDLIISAPAKDGGGRR